MNRIEVMAELEGLAFIQNPTKAQTARAGVLLGLARELSDIEPAITEQRVRNARGLASRETRSPSWFRKYLYGAPLTDEERTQFTDYQREQRDLTSGEGAFPGSTSGPFTPLQFVAQVIAMLRQTDALFDETVISVVETPRGGPCAVPNLSDVDSAAVQVTQGEQSVLQEPVLGSVQFPTAPGWRSGYCKISVELSADSAIPLDQVLSEAFAIRFQRGIGAANVNSLLSAASLGATANGSSANDGTSANGSNSIGSDDLLSLMESIDPAYLASPKCAWVMNWSTLIAIAQLKDKNGRPLKLIHADPTTGVPMLFWKRIALCPSMPSIGVSGSPAVGRIPVCFGDLSRAVGRRVAGGMMVQRNIEKWAEYGQIGYQAFMRSDFAVAVTPGADPPVKYLQNAA